MRDTSRPVPFLPVRPRRVRAVARRDALEPAQPRDGDAPGPAAVDRDRVPRCSLAAHLPAEITGLHLYGYLVALFWVRNALPLAALFYATALIADEVEGRTLTYLLTRPVQRRAILAGKFAAYLVTTLCLALPAAVLTFFVLATSKGVERGRPRCRTSSATWACSR